MLRLTGRSIRHCDGVSRRDFLRIGSLGFAGLTLGDLLRTEALAGRGSSTKALINIHLDGGPPQLDTIDPKPEAPVEIRGDFQTIPTRLSGIRFCELLPKLAGMADQLVLLRSLVGSAGAHDAFQCQSGYRARDLASLGGRPALGCVVNRLQSSARDPVPAFVDLMQGRPLVRDSARPGFLGPAFKAFRPDISHMFHRELEPGMMNELVRQGDNHAVSLKLDAALSAERLQDRQMLLESLDLLRRDLDSTGMMEAMDRFDQQAAGILTSGKLADALDLEKEDPRVLARYTSPEPSGGEQFYTSEGPESSRKFLLARRLIEAGVRCVSVSISDFDTHSKNFPRMRHLLPTLDHGLHTLITDLQERGMLEDVTIIAWGEFGRTPRIDAQTGGRHHWPQVGPAILAGGGLPVGQVIGQTDRDAGQVTSRPVSYQDVFATLYHQLGLDSRRVTIVDPQGRPQFLIDDGQPLRELV
jgi:uncharacterized protein (DUF1501 family)